MDDFYHFYKAIVPPATDVYEEILSIVSVRVMINGKESKKKSNVVCFWKTGVSIDVPWVGPFIDLTDFRYDQYIPRFLPNFKTLLELSRPRECLLQT